MMFAGIGVVLNLAAWFLGLGSVAFDGVVAGQPLHEYPEVAVREVGFFYAPNWAIASVFLIPGSILFLFSARASVEPTFDALIERGMLRRIDGEDFDKENFLHRWEVVSARWMLGPIAIVSIVFAVTIPMDFMPVVWQWLWDPSSVSSIIGNDDDPVSINHGVYEFDWSIAALYSGADVHPLVNLAFSFSAYMIVAVVGSGTILAVFFWLPAMPSFLRSTNLRRHGWEIVPDINSDEVRCGFEVFEPFYRHVVWASIFTCVLALSMHVQNVFLRSPTFEHIGAMTFSSAIQIVSENGTDFGKIVTLLLRNSDGVAGPTGGDVNLQFGIAFIGILLLVGIVMAVLLTWLSITPRLGAAALRKGGGLKAEHKQALDEMLAWPLPDMPRKLLLAMALILVLSIYLVNLVALLLVVLAVLFITSTIAKMLWIRTTHRRNGQKVYEDDEDV